MRRSITYILIIVVMIASTTLVGFANDTLKTQKIDVLEVISPTENVIYSDILLISVKVQNEKSFRFTLYADNAIVDTNHIEIHTVLSSGAITVSESTEEKELSDNVILYGPVEVNTTGEFSFYTLQLEKLIPGKYQILIEETGNSSNSANYTILKKFEIKDKSERPEDRPKSEIFNNQKNNGIQALESLIKSIFGN